MSTKTASVFKYPDVAENLSTNSRQICSYFAVTAYKAPNNIVFFCIKSITLIA